MKNSKIDNLINDIMSLDPELKKYENEIKKITNHLIKAKPNLKIDSNFKLELKNTIMKKISKIKNNEKEKNAFNWGIFSKKLAFSLGALVLAIAIIIPLKNNLNKDNDNRNIASKNEQFIRVEDEAFGKIAFNESAQNTNNGEINSSDLAERTTVLGMGAGGDVSVSSDTRILPYPYEPVNYEFEYIGEDFELNGEKVDVYKKIKKSIEVKNIKDAIFNNNLSLFKLDNFKDMSDISNISIKQDKKYGYIININPQVGDISLYANWETWPQPFKDCQDDACYQRNNLSINDVPEDDKIIEVADKFISDNNINLDNYGDPVITNDFREMYETSEDKSNVYIPDQISVVYPLILNDVEAIDNGGQKTGLFISVDIREMKVYSINNLSINNFEVSAYKAINDKNTILNYLKQGGLYPNYTNPDASKTITVKIGSPEKTLVKLYKYDNSKGRSDEYFAPALSFPIVETSSENNYYRDYIVIPLAEDMIEKHVDIMPMPILEMAR